jgi:dynamin 1-like protein
VNRSQQDIITKKTIRDALKAEDEYFSTHPVYRNIASRCGTNFLSRTLNRVSFSQLEKKIENFYLNLKFHIF